MKWQCRIMGVTHGWNGRKITLDRTFEGAGNLKKFAIEALRKRRDKGVPFIGASVTVLTPIHHIDFLVESDENGEMVLICQS